MPIRLLPRSDPDGILPRVIERNELAQGLTITIQGFFAAVFFSWARPSATAPDWIPPAVVAGTVLGILLALAGIIIAVSARRRGAPAALTDPMIRRRYLIIAAIEAGLLALFIVLMWAIWGGGWIPALIAAAVGVHFLALAGVFGDGQLFFAGVGILTLAALAAVAGLIGDVVPGDITTPGTALILLIGALVAVAAEAQPRRTAALA